LTVFSIALFTFTLVLEDTNGQHNSLRFPFLTEMASATRDALRQ
jgi:hypothetical protein